MTSINERIGELTKVLDDALEKLEQLKQEQEHQTKPSERTPEEKMRKRFKRFGAEEVEHYSGMVVQLYDTPDMFSIENNVLNDASNFYRDSCSSYDILKRFHDTSPGDYPWETGFDEFKYARPAPIVRLGWTRSDEIPFRQFLKHDLRDSESPNLFLVVYVTGGGGLSIDPVDEIESSVDIDDITRYTILEIVDV